MGTYHPTRETRMSVNTTEAPTPNASETPAPDAKPTDTPVPDTGDKDWQAEAEKWKSFARKHEEQAKANADKAKRLDELEESQKSELQKAADRAAAAEARAAEVEVRATRAEIAAAKGVPAALLSGTTAEELEASADALLEFRSQAPKPDFGGGDRGKDVAGLKQVTESELNSMTPAQINTARAEGRLNAILGKKS